MTQTVVGIFDTPDAAHNAEETLVNRGIDRSAIHLAATDSTTTTAGTSHHQGHYHGTMSGIRNFFSELFGTGDTDDASRYSEAIRRGGVMLAIDVPDNADIEPVRDALVDAGAIDIDERAEYWRQQGWSGYDPNAQPYTADQIAQERSTVLPVIQEQLEVGKREVPQGLVRVFSRTVETPFRQDVELREEHATIERRPVDRPVNPADMDAFREKSIEVQEMAEKAVVNKSARVVEEVVVGKEVSRNTEVIQDTLRRTEVDVDRGAAATGATASGYAATTGTRTGMDMGTSSGEISGGSAPYEDYEPYYRQDFQTRYATQGGSYEDYAPAYRYGHTMASDSRYRGRAWADVEPEMRRDWERQYPNSGWERFKLAVQHGWDRMTGTRS